PCSVPATPESAPLPLHDALPICEVAPLEAARRVETRPASEHAPAVHGSAHHQHRGGVAMVGADVAVLADRAAELGHREHHDVAQDRKSTRLNSSHVSISYAVFCL